MFRKSSVLVVLIAASIAPGADLEIQPPHITLTGPHGGQRLLVISASAGKAVADVTGQAKFESSNPKVATVDDKGIVRAKGDGMATITAILGNNRATTPVIVEKTQEPFDWSFRNHVVPVFTKIGCNSGACHGALAGKGGFKLSLRGYAPADDYFVLTRQAQSRRINKMEPARSLMLLKPTLALPHGGGLKIEVQSPEYNLLADWIASGAPGPGPNDPRIQKLEVFPPEAVLSLKEKLQVLVRARYSDGHSEDVTRWARFASTEDLVAGVDDGGLVQVTGHGEAAISARFPTWLPPRASPHLFLMPSTPRFSPSPHGTTSSTPWCSRS